MDVAARTKGSPLASVAWGNDEAGPKVHWSSNCPWRGDSRHAAMVPKVMVIQQHCEFFEHTYDVLSNDNDFLPCPDNSNSSFQQRTLVAFCGHTTSPNQPPWNWCGSQCSTRYCQRDTLNAMALLGLLGNPAHPAAGLQPALTSQLGMLATSAAGWSSAGAEPMHPVTSALL